MVVLSNNPLITNQTSHMQSITLIELAWELHNAQVRAEDIAIRVGKHRSTVYRWINSIKKNGLKN